MDGYYKIKMLTDIRNVSAGLILLVMQNDIASRPGGRVPRPAAVLGIIAGPGANQNQWILDGNGWFYMDIGRGMLTVLQTIGERSCYFNEDGSMAG